MLPRPLASVLSVLELWWVKQGLPTYGRMETATWAGRHHRAYALLITEQADKTHSCLLLTGKGQSWKRPTASLARLTDGGLLLYEASPWRLEEVSALSNLQASTQRVKKNQESGKRCFKKISKVNPQKLTLKKWSNMIYLKENSKYHKDAHWSQENNAGTKWVFQWRDRKHKIDQTEIMEPKHTITELKNSLQRLTTD